MSALDSVFFFFAFSSCGFFFYVIAIGLRVSCLGFDVFFWIFDLRLPFLCYCALFKGVGLFFDAFFWFLDLRLLFLFYCAWFMGVGFRF